MKAKKRLLTSIVCLILSLAVSVWACFAWFTSNSAVEANGVNSPVRTSGTNISVKAYFLKQAYSYGGRSYTVTNQHPNDSNNNSAIDGQEAMLKFNTDPLTASAVLLEVTCVSENAGVYKISAECESQGVSATDIGVVEGVQTYESNLSNVVHFNDTTVTNTTTVYSISDDEVKYSFVNGDTVKRSKDVKEVSFVEGDKVLENGKNVYKKTVYIHMDYDAAHIDYLFGKLGVPGALKDILFKNDISLKLTEGSPNLEPDADTAIENVVALINAIGTVTEESGPKITAARAAYTKLSASKQEAFPAETLAVLTTAEEQFSAFAVDNFKSMVTALGEPALTDSFASALEHAETAYNSLTDEQKQAVATEYATLTAKRTEYDRLVSEQHQEAGDTAKVENVVSLITAIGTVDTSTACKGRIDDARAAYDALANEQTPDLQKRVTNYSTLTAAEAEYDRLLADERAINGVIDKINAIGTVDVTDACKANIDTARTEYNNLTQSQKDAFPDETLGVLTNAETKYNQLKQQAQDVKAQIADLPAADAVTLSDKATIQAARTAYDALTGAQKSLVDNLAKLTAAEDKIKELEGQDTPTPPTPTGTITVLFNEQGNYDTYNDIKLTVNGTYENRTAEDGVKYVALKLSKSAHAVKFETAAKMKLTIGIRNTNGSKIKFGNEIYADGDSNDEDNTKDGKIVITIDAGEYTLGYPSTSTYLYYLKLEPTT